MLLDIRILELLSSKICHDLISPVGAINNGVELIEDIGPSVTEDAMKLISNSAQQAAKRLKLFRVAYGKAGAEGVTLRDTRKTAHDYLTGGKIQLTWDDALEFPELGDKRGALKMILCILMVAEDVLSHGGTITVETIAQNEANGVCITASGTHATLSEPIKKALSGEVSVEEVVPRTVHAYVVHCFAEHYDLKISARQLSEEKLSLLLLP
jgi:histidine phosphotransferase ChpT